MSPLNYMRLHDHSSENPRQHWTNASNGKIRCESVQHATGGDDEVTPPRRTSPCRSVTPERNVLASAVGALPALAIPCALSMGRARALSMEADRSCMVAIVNSFSRRKWQTLRSLKRTLT